MIRLREFTSEDDRTKYGDHNVLASVETENSLPCSGVVSLMKESEHLLKLTAISIPKRKSTFWKQRARTMNGKTGLLLIKILTNGIVQFLLYAYLKEGLNCEYIPKIHF